MREGEEQRRTAMGKRGKVKNELIGKSVTPTEEERGVEEREGGRGRRLKESSKVRRGELEGGGKAGERASWSERVGRGAEKGRAGRRNHHVTEGEHKQQEMEGGN